MPRRLVVFALLSSLLILLQGCSLLGLAVGSQIPHFDPIQHATRGDALRVHMDDGDTIRGAALAVSDTTITLLPLDETRERTISLAHVHHLYRRHKSDVFATFLVGAITDGLAITSLIFAAALGAFH